jgi:hypothetical protein
VGVSLGVGVGVGLCVAVSVDVGASVGVGVSVAVGVSLAVSGGVGVSVAVGVSLPVAVIAVAYGDRNGPTTHSDNTTAARIFFVRSVHEIVAQEFRLRLARRGVNVSPGVSGWRRRGRTRRR